ncbi:hypothetical protein ACTHGU_13035 [Chitinophagaceae bacterium MMS25-I14]
MSATEDYNNIFQGLQQDWGIVRPEIVSEETLLEQLELKLGSILAAGAEGFFQLMYRLDIPEKKLMEAMYESTTPAATIARLIYLRQLQKIRARAAHRKNNTDGSSQDDDDLRW